MTVFSSKSFDELTVHELYDIISLREQIFVVEQNCVYLDADGLDKYAIHVIGRENNSLVTYCRVLPPGCVYAEPAIGRVVVKKEYRGLTIGKELMRFAIHLSHSLYPQHSIRISAQEYLLRFYSSLGFESVSEVYLEDGIPHIEMLLHT